MNPIEVRISTVKGVSGSVYVKDVNIEVEEGVSIDLPVVFGTRVDEVVAEIKGRLHLIKDFRVSVK